jgi:hypothetical protein
MGCAHSEFVLRPRETKQLWEPALKGRTSGKWVVRTEERDTEYQGHNGYSCIEICAIAARVVVARVGEHVLCVGV